jgi:hypothetical protein
VFGLVAALIAVVAWAIIVLGDGVFDPWPWIFAVLAFMALQLAFGYVGPLRRFRQDG